MTQALQNGNSHVEVLVLMTRLPLTRVYTVAADVVAVCPQHAQQDGMLSCLAETETFTALPLDETARRTKRITVI